MSYARNRAIFLLAAGSRGLHLLAQVWGFPQKIRNGAPKCLWDHYIELEGLICSHTANDIYATAGEVPETTMKGGTADISQICKFAWYDWVMFRDTVNTITFPDDKLTLGRYLGPATDVGSALTAKILKQNGQYICRSTLHHLTPWRRLSASAQNTLQPDCISTK